ncbi:TonB-dependent receptor domain-containing protein [Sphingomonas sp.]|jgi:outer membrane receptor protein involved in Fe transport|uniref:TonB-dependent receptor domain-containing protein n=1 Tax=Sphingomonas sp. TaxID=28214 RepID=UPI002E337310|nr:TonB-dependent receptor [Sphingomonas sp.]HEX4693504.1 TonB-dependent receptor [Sphingomonas sp.]
MHLRRARSIVRLALSTTAIIAAMTSAEAFAQTTSTDDQTATPPGVTPPPGSATPTPTPASTQGGDGDIIVTGSRIATKGYDSAQPTIVLDSKSIESRGFTTLGQALNELPAFGVPDSSPVGLQSSFGPGQSFVNFFGLGSQRTLTLVNGRRFVGSNTAAIFGPTGQGGDQVDLNIIPTKLIDRVETIAVGGAPIYGSDAIAGTINVILKKKYDGVELDGQYQISEYGDAPDYRIRLLAGHNFLGGRANLTFAGEYNEGKGLLYTDRGLSGQGRYYDTATTPGYGFTQEFYPDRRIPGISETGIPLVGRYLYDVLGVNSVLPPKYQQAFFGGPYSPGVNGGVPGQQLKFDASGNLVPIDFGKTTSFTNASGGNGFSLTDLSNLLTNTKRYSGIVLGSFDISSNIRLFGEAWYSHSEGTNLRDQPEYKSGFFDAPGAPAGDVILSVNNPFLTPAARASIIQSINDNGCSTFYTLSDQCLGYTANQNYFYLGRANTDLVTGRVRGQVNIVRFVAGVDGSFNVFGDKTWNWEIYGNYGRSVTESRIPTIVEQNFLNAAGAITAANPNGIPCLAGLTNSPAPTVSSTCAPLDLFGTNVASQAAKDYITGIATPRSANTQKDFLASLSGPLFKLPGGDFSFALGYEHRDEHERFNPGTIFLGAPDSNPLVDTNGDGDPTNDRTSYGQNVPIAPINAGYNTDEVFGEVKAQLIGPDQNIPLLNMLEFQGAVRYVNHSVNGGAVTFTAGGRWAPVKDLTIRGNFTRSIRSPSITESQNPAQSYFGFATDPCDVVGNQINNGPAPATRAANCRAALTAAGLTPAQIATYDSFSDDRSFTQAVAGDTSLKNEKANSWTVGAIFQPRFFRGFTVSADYVNILVKNVISSLGADQVLSNCYDATNYPNNPFCARIRRDTAGQLSYIVTGYANQDQLHYRGIVASGDYRTRTPFLGADSAIGLNVSYQHLFELSTTAQGTKTETAGDVGYSKDKGVATLTYENSWFQFLTQVSYIGPAYQDINNAPTFRPFNREHGVAFVNLGVSFDVAKRFTFRLNVDNVFGQLPPYPSSGTSDVYFRGLLGRFFRAGASVKF